MIVRVFVLIALLVLCGAAHGAASLAPKPLAMGDMFRSAPPADAAP